MPKPSGNKQLATFARVGAVGIELGLSVAVGVIAGGWLDEKLSTQPYLTLFGLLIGVGFHLFHHGPSGERRAAGEQIIERAAQAVDVRTDVDGMRLASLFR